MEGNPAPSRITAPIPAMESVPMMEPPLSTETIQAKVEIKPIAPEATGELVQKQIDTIFDELTKGDEALLWRNRPADQPKSPLQTESDAWHQTTDEEMKKGGKYIAQVIENGQRKFVERSSSDLISQVLADCQKHPDDPEIQSRYQFLQERTFIHGLPGEEKPLTLQEWEGKGRPAGGEFRILAEGTKPAETSETKQSKDAAETPEAAEARKTYITELRKGLRILYHGAKGQLFWEFGTLSSENRRINQENPDHVGKMLREANPGANFEDPEKMSEDDVLTNHYRQLERERLMLLKAPQPDETAIARIVGEQERVRGYHGQPDTIDVSNVTAQFEEDGILGDERKRANYQMYKNQVEAQRDNFIQQIEALDENRITTIFGHDITKKDLKSWGSTTGMILGLSTLLLFLEGEKEKPQVGGQPMH